MRNQNPSNRLRSASPDSFTAPATVQRRGLTKLTNMLKRLSTSGFAVAALATALSPTVAHASSYTLGAGPAVAINPAIDPLILANLQDTTVTFDTNQYSSATIWSQPPATKSITTINSGVTLNSPTYGVQAWSWTGLITVTNNGTIKSATDGINIIGNFGYTAAAGTTPVTVNGTGTIDAGGTAVNLWQGGASPVTVQNLSAIKAGIFGITVR